jgi:hypothetical protein
MIGRYLDLLARENCWDAIDRAVTAQGWCSVFMVHSEDRCLLGHLHDAVYVGDHLVERDHRACNVYGTFAGMVGFRFDRLTDRFGVERVVRAIKQRAGKHTRPILTYSKSVALVRVSA